MDFYDIPPPAPNATESTDPGRTRLRPFLGVEFACCGVYSRIHRNTAGTRYVGHCPRCARPVSVSVGVGGQAGRFFRVD